MLRIGLIVAKKPVTKIQTMHTVCRCKRNWPADLFSVLVASFLSICCSTIRDKIWSSPRTHGEWVHCILSNFDASEMKDTYQDRKDSPPVYPIAFFKACYMVLKGVAGFKPCECPYRVNKDMCELWVSKLLRPLVSRWPNWPSCGC